jgi:hypothetical protein
MKSILIVTIVLCASCSTQSVLSSWEPALADPNSPAIISTVLSDWFKQHPKVKNVLVRASYLPGNRVPQVEGIKFIKVESSRELTGEKPGDTGISFTEFTRLGEGKYRVRFSMLWHVTSTISEGVSTQYSIRRGDDGWRIVDDEEPPERRKAKSRNQNKPTQGKKPGEEGRIEKKLSEAEKALEEFQEKHSRQKADGHKTLKLCIVDPDGNPLKHVDLFVFFKGNPRHTISGTPPGGLVGIPMPGLDAKVVVRHDDYPPLSANIPAEEDGPIKIQFQHGVRVKGIVTTERGQILARHTVHFHTIKADGKPGFCVGTLGMFKTYSFPADGPPTAMHIGCAGCCPETDENGMFTTRPLPPGRYIIKVGSPSRPFSTAAYETGPTLTFGQGQTKLVQIKVRKKKPMQGEGK